MGTGYAFPATSKYGIELNDWNGECVAVTMQGRRESDEDAALVLAPIKNFPNCRLAALFDGHNGSKTSFHCVQRIAHFIGECNDFSDAELKKACLKLDREIIETPYGEEGSTGIFVIIQKIPDKNRFRLIVANVGDSRCFLLRENGTYIILSEDHKPSLPEERRRIEAADGTVTMDRVMGNMAVSRAFGDYFYKCRPNLAEDKQMIICIPDIKEVMASPGDVIVLACDGIYEQLNWDNVATFTKETLPKFSLYETSVKLIDYSLTMGSLDNMTVLLIRLTSNEFQTPHTSYNYLPGILFGDRTKWSEEREKFFNELNVLGFSYKQIRKILAVCPNYSVEKTVCSQSVLQYLLEEQRKGERLKINVATKGGGDLFKNNDQNIHLHFVPFTSRVIKSEKKIINPVSENFIRREYEYKCNVGSEEERKQDNITEQSKCINKNVTLYNNIISDYKNGGNINENITHNNNKYKNNNNTNSEEKKKNKRRI